MEIRPLIVGSLMGPSSSPSFRQGPGGHIPFSKLPAIELYRDGLLAQSRNSSLRAVTCLSRSSPVCPGCHQSFPVVTRSIPECQMANASVKYLETPTTERTDRESSEECPRHRTFRPKLLTFSGGGPHPSDQAGVPVGYYPTFTRFRVIDEKEGLKLTWR